MAEEEEEKTKPTLVPVATIVGGLILFATTGFFNSTSADSDTIIELQQRVQVLESTATAIGTQNENLRGTIADFSELEARLRIIEGQQLAERDGDLPADVLQDSQIAELDEEISDAESRLASLEREIAAAEARISVLEAQAR